MPNWYRGKGFVQSNQSNAEIAIFNALQQQGYNTGICTPPDSGITFDFEKDRVEGTFPDFLWPQQKVAVYIDGNPVHYTLKQSIKDDLINDALWQRDYDVLRYAYLPPLTKKRLKEIVSLIIRHLKRRGYKK